MPPPIHLAAGDYDKLFPAGIDEFPTLIDREHYIDAWHFNTIFDSLEEIENYILEHRENIEAALGSDVIGDEGALIISIPPACYGPYTATMAWDSNLLEENIKAGVTIFGVTGTYAP